MKNFDQWNNLKKEIHVENKKYHEGDIWWCNLGQNIGDEQNGTGDFFDRPILIIKGFNKRVCLVVPLTTKEKHNKFFFCIGNIQNKNNFVILSQIKLIDTKRLINQIGFIQKNRLDEIKKAIWNLIR